MAVRGRRRRGRDSRVAILEAAAAEFASRGFAGAGVERIARRASLNKAMIYYHFKSKASLYQVVLSDFLLAVGKGARAILAANQRPEEKMDALIEALAAEFIAHPYSPPMMMREIAGGGRRLEPKTLRAMAFLSECTQSIITEGIRTGRFEKVNPMIASFAIIDPIILYFARGPVRQAVARATGHEWPCPPADLVRYLQWAARRILCRREHRSRPSAGDEGLTANQEQRRVQA
jgi:TetR/AcrR family transcriptional regulator